MGMAASQARLLSITARIHDVEYQAQSIQNAKIQLATQEDKAYREYNAALEATTLTINAIDLKSGEKSTVPATFNNLCSRNRLTGANGDNYAIRNKEGLLLVENEIEEGYNTFKGQKFSDDPYQFALYMCGGKLTNNNIDMQLVQEAEPLVYEKLGKDEKSELLTNCYEKLKELAGEDIYNREAVAEDKRDEYDKTLATFRKELYKNHTADIINEAAGVSSTELIAEEDVDKDLFNYYVSIYKQIQLCGGCASIDEYDDFNGNGDAANNSDWLQAMVQSGQFTIEVIDENKKTGKTTFVTTSPGSDSCLAYTTTSTIDKRALAKAEAEYEHKLKQIDKKDKMFDLDLSKLETERTALTTEYESVKKVIEDNIDRTFGIFS